MSNHTKTAAPHILPLKLYLTVGAILLILTVVTVFVSEIPLGGWNLVAALAIAITKAMLVAFFFMHLYYDYKLYFFIFSVAVTVLAVFIVFTMFDTLDRGAIYEIKAGPINPKAIIYTKPATTGVDTSKAADTTRSKAPGRPADSTDNTHDSAATLKPAGY